MAVDEGLNFLTQELGFVLKSEQREALELLVNCNNCSLSVSVFSFCKSIAVQFQTFVPHGKQTLLEKDSPSLRTTKVRFLEGWPALVMSHLF